MRKYYQPINLKIELGEDQPAHLGLDINSQLKRSVILPKIYSRYIGIEAQNMYYRRKMEEQDSLSEIKDQLYKLRNQLNRIEWKRNLNERFQTEMTNRNSFEESEVYTHQFYHVPQKYIYENTVQYPIKDRNNKRIARKTDKSEQLKKPLKQIHNSIYESKFPQNKEKQVIKKNNNQVEQKSKVDQKIKQKKSSYNKRLRRKFRVAVYAVFFSIFFPSYSRKIYKNRLKNHINIFPYQVAQRLATKAEVMSKYKLNQIDISTKLKQQINIIKIVKDLHPQSFLGDGGPIRKIKNHFQNLLDYDSEKQIKKQKKVRFNFQQQLNYSKNTALVIQKLEFSLLDIISKFQAIFDNHLAIKQYWNAIHLNSINNSFIHNSYPKICPYFIEIGMVRLNHYKQILLVYDSQTEQILIMLDIICRLFIYNSFCLLNQIGSAISQMQKFMINTVLSVLYLICIEMAQQKINSYLKDNTNSLDEKSKARNKRIRPLKPLIINKANNIKNQSKKIKIIQDIPNLSNAEKIIQENKVFKDNIISRLKQLNQSVYSKVKLQCKKQYQSIVQKTFREKNIIKNDNQKFKRNTSNSQNQIYNTLSADDLNGSKPKIKISLKNFKTKHKNKSYE